MDNINDTPMDKTFSCPDFLIFLNSLESKLGTEFWKYPRTTGFTLFNDSTAKNILKNIRKYHEDNLVLTDILIRKGLKNVEEVDFGYLTYSETERESWPAMSIKLKRIYEYSGINHTGTLSPESDMSILESLVKCTNVYQHSTHDILGSFVGQAGILKYILHLPVFDDILFSGYRHHQEFYNVTNRYWKIDSTVGVLTMDGINKSNGEDIWGLGIDLDTMVPIPLLFSKKEERQFLSSEYSWDQLTFDEIFPRDKETKKKIVINIIRYMTLKGFNPVSLMFDSWEANYTMNKLLSFIGKTKDDLTTILNVKLGSYNLNDSVITSPKEITLQYSSSETTKFNLRGIDETKIFTSGFPENINACNLLIDKFNKTSPGDGHTSDEEVLSSYETEMSVDEFFQIFSRPYMQFDSGRDTINITRNGTYLTTLRSSRSDDFCESYNVFDCFHVFLELNFLVNSFGGDIEISEVLSSNKTKRKTFKITSKDKNSVWFFDGLDTNITAMYEFEFRQGPSCGR